VKVFPAQASAIPENATVERVNAPAFDALVNFASGVVMISPSQATVCDTPCPNSTPVPVLSEMLAASVEPNIATAAIDARPRTTFDEELFLRTGRGEFSNFNISI